MGIIRIKNMEFYAYHGHFAEEQVVGNNFIVNLEIDTDIDTAGVSDNLEDALNYVEAYDIIKQQMEIKASLLENVVKRILDELYNKFGNQIKRATIEVCKMNPPVGGKMDCVSVEATR